ncbi:MAG: DJ-1/PfpI family protein [Sphingomonadaceae bacterium]|nr:DJ-1/PfpI family protein [Sphingomonadaceae bacterium]
MTYRIGFLLYPDLTQLDMTGPAQVLSRMPDAEVVFVWKTLDPVMSDCGLALMPTHRLADCPPLDMVCVPGGYGCTALMADTEILDWLRERAATADLVTSVCTGSLILAAAGLLDGYRAGCHWAWRDQLALFGATPVAERVVSDRNRITGGGVTAGIDFAFAVIERLKGRDVAEAVQLTLEYDPAPIGGGTPETARPEIVATVRRMMAGRGLDERQAAIERIAAMAG